MIKTKKIWLPMIHLALLAFILVGNEKTLHAGYRLVDSGVAQVNEKQKNVDLQVTWKDLTLARIERLFDKVDDKTELQFNEKSYSKGIEELVLYKAPKMWNVRQAIDRSLWIADFMNDNGSDKGIEVSKENVDLQFKVIESGMAFANAEVLIQKQTHPKIKSSENSSEISDFGSRFFIKKYMILKFSVN